MDTHSGQIASGARVGPYEILGLLGAGGMGEVYRARDTRLGRDVAIKVLSAEFAGDPDRLRRFEHEARAVAALDHPNILAIHDVGTHEGSPYLVTELLEGETLRERLEAEGLTVRRAVDVGIQIAKGLAAAHGKGIVHRDLKPSNVFLTKDDQVKLLDFGLAKLTRPEPAPGAPTEASVSSTETGAVMGTVGYMSPEQVRGQPTDHRTDIFAFGCVLHEMLSGERPFRGDTTSDVMAAILKEDPAPLPPRVPPALQGIVSRCLEKRPEDRFDSAHDLALALQAISTVPESVPLEPPRGMRGAAWLLSHTSVVVGVGATVLLIAAGLTAWLWKGKASTQAPIRSIAVLPLVNVSGDPAQEYFSDGMTEALIASLAQIKAIKVISRTSVMLFKKANEPLPQVASELGVEGVVEGSVLRSGNRVRITAQLIDARQDRHLWASSYEREMTDVLALQSEVVRAIAGEIRAQVTPQEQARLASARPVNPDVYELCLKGWHFRWEDSAEGFLKAIEYFQRAINLDPSYAPAHAGLSEAYSVAALFNALPFKEVMPKAKAAARRALDLDESLAEAHVAIGMVTQTFDWDWAGAEREYRRALELNPNSTAGLTWYAWYLTNMKRFEEAVAVRRRAVELDPLSVPANDFLGWTLYYAGRYDESIRQYRKALEMDPKNAYLHMWLARSYAAKGERGEVITASRTALELAPEDLAVLTICGYSLGLSGNRQEARVLLDRVNVLAARKPVDPFLLAWLYDGLGDKEQALELLEQAFDERSPNLAGDPDIDFGQSLGSDPRYQALRRRMNLPASAIR